MSDDRLLRELGQVARERAGPQPVRFDERWDALAAGTLTADTDAQLRALAETSEEARVAYEAFRPLGAEFQAGVVQAIRAQLAKPPVKPSIFGRRSAIFAGLGAATAAAAAAVMALLRLTAPLPGYALAEIYGGARATRGDTKVPDLAPGDRFRLELRPDSEVARAKSLETRCVLLDGGELRRLQVTSERYAGGFVKLEGALDRDLPPGDWTLWTIVARPGKLPELDELRSLSSRGPVRRRDWVAVPATLRIRSRAP